MNSKRQLGFVPLHSCWRWRVLNRMIRRLLDQHRNLGKAFYENPTTQQEAVAEFQQALAIAPDSARDKLNYALALLKVPGAGTGSNQALAGGAAPGSNATAHLVQPRHLL